LVRLVPRSRSSGVTYFPLNFSMNFFRGTVSMAGSFQNCAIGEWLAKVAGPLAKVRHRENGERVVGQNFFSGRELRSAFQNEGGGQDKEQQGFFHYKVEWMVRCRWLFRFGSPRLSVLVRTGRFEVAVGITGFVVGIGEGIAFDPEKILTASMGMANPEPFAEVIFILVRPTTSPAR